MGFYKIVFCIYEFLSAIYKIKGAIGPITTAISIHAIEFLPLRMARNPATRILKNQILIIAPFLREAYG